MSIHAISWVLKHSEEKLARRLVLLSLADHAKDDGTCAWPGVDTIARDARLSRRAVQSSLRGLEADGAIASRGKSRSGTVIYDVLMGGEEAAPGGAQITTSGGEARAPEPSENRQSSPTGEDKRAQEPIGFAAWLGYHSIEHGKVVGREQPAPRAGTRRRAALAATFSSLMGEGFVEDDFRLASDGVLADEFMVERGHTAPENVLRVRAFERWVGKGRDARMRRAQGTKYHGLEERPS